jgi:C1A family cysteine protease
MERPDANGVIDNGTYVRDAISAVKKKGVCAEQLWPYHPDKVNTEPSQAAYTAAQLHQLIEYRRLKHDSMDELRDCLARGYPFVFGMHFGSDYPQGAAKTGYVPVPSPAELANFANLGKHAVMAVGYNDQTQRLTFMNSKGTGWGDNGFGTLSYEYVTQHGLCRDFWTIRKVEGVGAAADTKK